MPFLACKIRRVPFFFKTKYVKLSIKISIIVQKTNLYRSFFTNVTQESLNSNSTALIYNLLVNVATLCDKSMGDGLSPIIGPIIWCRWSASEVAQSCLTLCDPMDCSLQGSSIHGIFQARVLEWVAISFSRASSRLRDRTQICIVGRCFTIWATREAHHLMRNPYLMRRSYFLWHSVPSWNKIRSFFVLWAPCSTA